jgi:hypothetical protein
MRRNVVLIPPFTEPPYSPATSHVMADETYVPVSQRATAELRARANEFREMAATATNQETADALLRLAHRLDAVAQRRASEGA